MDMSNNCDEGEYCLVAISLPLSEEGTLLSHGIHNGDREHTDNFNETSIMCPPGTQFISLEDANEYLISSQKYSVNASYIEALNEVGETINYVIEDEGNLDPRCYYAVGVPQDIVEGEGLSQQEVLEADDNQYVPDSNQECAYSIQDISHQYDVDGELQQLDMNSVPEEEGSVRLYEESTDYMEVQDQQTDTLLYSNGNVYVLRQQEHVLDHGETHCDNVLQEYGYVFVNEEEELPAQLEEGVEEEEEDEGEEEEEEERVDVETLGEVVSALKCVSCDFTTLDKALLVQHHSQVHCYGPETESDLLKEKENGKRVVYVCGQCSVELPTVETCRQHMILQHKLLVGSKHVLDTEEEICKEKENIDISEKNEENIEEPSKRTISQVTEDKDPFTPLDSSTIDAHVRQYWLHHGTSKNVKARLCSDRKIRCTLRKCVYRFSTRDKMEQHRSCHSTTSEIDPRPPYTCTQCDTIFAKWPQCSLHLHKTHQISLDIIICPLCGIHSTHSVRMMATHLQKHAEKEGNIGGEQNKRWYSKKVCQICHKTYVNSKILNKHIKIVHHKLKPFKCNVCGHSSSSKNMLKMHMRQHTGEKPFQCEFCSYRTGDHNTLHRHHKTHTREYTYSCILCPYKCIQSGALRAHMKSRHPETLHPVEANKLQQAPS